LKTKGAAAVSENLALIIVPLFAVLSLAIMFVVIPIFASMSGVGTSASAGLMSMSGTLASFSPIYGIGLAVGTLVLFFSLAAWFGKTGISGAAAVSENLALIIVPLFAVLSLAIMFVVIPIFASMSGVGASGSAGLMSMSSTLASFSPIYGIGLAVGTLVLFFSLAAWFGGAKFG